MRHAIVFSGAGLSADSGIPTFRDSNGLWENYKVEDVAEHEAWFKNKELVLKFYEERYNQYIPCKPHAGHYALAKLQEKFTVVNITQNIDNLLEKAGCTEVWHLHGLMTQKKCEWHKEITNLDGDARFICDYKADITEPVKLGDVCPKCNSQCRPDVVWFNEAVNIDYNQINELLTATVSNDGVFICVGTSVQVYPAAFMVSWFKGLDHKYIVDKNPQNIPGFHIKAGNASEVLPKLVEELLNT
jgi:NAD-dependent deacetylase